MSNKNNSSEDEKQLTVNEAIDVEVENVTSEKDSAEKAQSEKARSEKNRAAEAKLAKDKKVKNEKKPSSTSSGKWLIYFLLLIIIAAGVAAAYYFWEWQQQQIASGTKQAQTITALKQQIEQIDRGVSSNSQANTQSAVQLQQLKEQILQTEQISQQAIAVVNRGQRDWALAEIDYLLRMAHQRIEVARDIAGAIAALKGADARIEQLGDLRLFKIRKQLAIDIASLNAIHQADISGMSLAIDQMINYAADLPFKSVKDELKKQISKSETADQTAEVIPAEEQTFVDSVMDTIKQIGDIKVHKSSVKTLSGEKLQTQVEGLLRTYLLSMRLAILRFDQQQFQYELTQTKDLINAHYEMSDNRLQQMEKLLNDYQHIQLNPDLPELTKSWQMLQQVMAAKPDKAETEKDNQESVK